MSEMKGTGKKQAVEKKPVKKQAIQEQNDKKQVIKDQAGRKQGLFTPPALMDNYLGNAIDHNQIARSNKGNDRMEVISAQYDENAKWILADKQILSWIMKYTVPEYEETAIDEIFQCIEAVHVSEIPISPGGGKNKGTSPRHNKHAGEAVTAIGTESSIPGEGKALYDIRFEALLPGAREGQGEMRLPSQLVINVEAQKAPYPGYDLTTRGIFYCARMLSDQVGRTVTGDNYDLLNKVTSIWICMNAPDKNANTITRYRIRQENVVGRYKGKARYDLLLVMMVRIPKPGREDKAHHKPTKLHRLLTVLFNQSNVEETKRVLKTEYQIETTVEIEGRLKNMCNLAEGHYLNGFEKGVESQREEIKATRKELRQQRQKTRREHQRAIKAETRANTAETRATAAEARIRDMEAEIINLKKRCGLI
ncbi:MAG: hypothetical protein IJ860_02120 [Eubacterium sp.]|nr:hypothetical protein [Eubacterium sp.]